MNPPSIHKPFDFSSAKPHYHNLSARNPFAFTFGWHKAGTGYQFDMHYGVEFGIVLKGEMDFIFSDSKIHLSAGNVWFCGMWEPHGWRTGQEPYEEVNLVIWPPALACLHFDEVPRFDWLSPFTVPPAQRPQTSGMTQRAMREIGAKIKKCLIKGGEQMDLWLRLYVMEAILLTAHQLPEPKAQAKPLAGVLDRLNQILKHFFDNRGLMTTADAAGMCGMNRNAFSLMFRRLMGLPFADFALRYRLNSAASCLRPNGESVKAIALLWGFADTSHFDRLFARYYGCTPHEYRQKNAK